MSCTPTATAWTSLRAWSARSCRHEQCNVISSKSAVPSLAQHAPSRPVQHGVGWSLCCGQALAQLGGMAAATGPATSFCLRISLYELYKSLSCSVCKPAGRARTARVPCYPAARENSGRPG